MTQCHLANKDRFGVGAHAASLSNFWPGGSALPPSNCLLQILNAFKARLKFLCLEVLSVMSEHNMLMIKNPAGLTERQRDTESRIVSSSILESWNFTGCKQRSATGEGGQCFTCSQNTKTCFLYLFSTFSWTGSYNIVQRFMHTNIYDILRKKGNRGLQNFVSCHKTMYHLHSNDSLYFHSNFRPSGFFQPNISLVAS